MEWFLRTPNLETEDSLLVPARGQMSEHTILSESNPRKKR